MAKQAKSKVKGKKTTRVTKRSNIKKEVKATKKVKVAKKVIKKAAKKTVKKIVGKVMKKKPAKKVIAKKKGSAKVKKIKKALSKQPKKTLESPAKKRVTPSKVKKIKAKGIQQKPIKKIKKEKNMKQDMLAKQPAEIGVAVMLGIGDIEPYVPQQSEEYMSENMKNHFRGILSAWKQQLMEGVDRTVHYMQDEAANFPDPSDRATQEEEFSLELRARDRERKLIKKIEDALNAIDEGEYGFCEACGEEIGLRRLEARPTATLCVDCKTLDEIREKQQGS